MLRIQRALSTLVRHDTIARRELLVDSFRRAVETHIRGDGKGAVFATAWLATDNIIVHLLHKHFPEVLSGMGLLAVDTLHLFPETHSVAAAVQAKYGKVAAVFKPAGLATQAEFIARHGSAESLNHGDFDLHSKVEPYNRGLAALGRDVLITGRRVDQGEKRVVLDVWEAQPRILNPMSAWLWPDVTAFCDAEGVPVNPAHNYVFRAPEAIPATERHLPEAPWVKADLGKPFWRASEAELLGSPPAPKASTYVFKSFGDTHTSVPVLPHESERAGRFVRSGAKTECGIHTRAARPGAPHGGKLVDLRASSAAAGGALLARASATLELTERQACDVELLVNGGFSPLTGFMTKPEYESVLAHGRLPEQQLWALPITLDTSDAAAAKVGAVVALRYKGVPVAALEVSSSWAPNRVAEAHAVFGTANAEHPGVLDLLTERGKWYVGGRVTGLAPLARSSACASPAEVRSKLPPGASVVAFQCRNPIHKAHFELVRRSLEDVKDGVVLIHPTVGPTQPDDIPGDVRVETYKALAAELANPRLVWEFLPFNMRMAGPREAIQHMIIRKNFGATHFIVGRDMAGTKSSRTSEDFYGPFDAQKEVRRVAEELAMQVVSYEDVVHTPEGFLPGSLAKERKLPVNKLSGTEFRKRLRAGEEIPEWFAFPSVVRVLRNANNA